MKNLRKSFGNGRSDSKRHISTPSSPLERPSLSKPFAGIQPPKKVIKALESYKSQAPQELSYEQGDFFHVITDPNGGLWYEAHNPATGARGLVAVDKFEEFSKGAPT